ncbi:PREDICTED: CMP-sialic acid transporter 1 [Polistes dominula]|uniref:CMP-sialic acid transporter 1 n=1 Tax=Polistes dominula TaxID=743375 RepID=A0ABM1J4J7_POLDO|nr:PREDICTED: CMP-sialic acid transporter 1 [Polistes dominula]
MGSINWGELFPGRWSPFIFLSYMALFINQGIIVTWSQKNGQYEYNIVTVVLLTEVLKLIVSAVLYWKDNKILSLFQEIATHKKVLLLYLIPSFLYCLYNNLAFINLAAFDPTTYYVLLQFRVVMTGIIFQVIFKKQLSVKQWLSLVLLTLGCMIKHLNISVDGNISAKFVLNKNIYLIFIQTFCSCLAGVYNEYLLKKGANINIFVQNVFMYIDSILCNVIVFLVLITFQTNVTGIFNNVGSSILMQPKVIIIMFNNTAIGIITSFFLKNLNSILKTFASALELVFTAVLCWLIFDIPIFINTVISIAMVSYSVILYSQNPVNNEKPKEIESKQLLV